ncbi:MAG: purine-nucleoside phosphorylase [Deltaproteobacteria bacterium]|nr:purine-nucleoside phosphorylase [Deltaproteobacteria bacterium]
MEKEILRAARFLEERMDAPPLIGMVTGTGLGDLVEAMEEAFRVPYEEIPHFPRSTTEGHRGNFVGGILAGRPIVALQGRFHLYEGYTPQDVILPVRVMAKLGIQYLLISSAAGGLNPLFLKGDLMVVTDHINLTGANPLVGPNLDAFGPRFPDMSTVYPADLVRLVRREALNQGIHLREGVYAGVLGPSLETPAETRFLRLIGADAVGMSTVQEAIAAVHCGLRVIAVVAITNVNLPDCMGQTTLEEVIEAAERAGPVLAALWQGVVAALPS